MISAEKPRNDLLGGIGLGNIGVHRNHRAQIFPGNSV
jgi:lactate dehydrogenase-like 2-hydroxyacid dehydrogenase